MNYKKINLAIVGATGLVGSTFLKVLEEKSYIQIENLYLFASQKSAGKTTIFRNKKYVVEELTKDNIKNKKIDYALFSAGGEISKKFAPIFAKNNTIVIDNSSYFRMDKNVPLIVPQVNAEKIFSHKNIIANPNCSTIECMAPLKALDNIFDLKEIVFSTYQAVSGSGMKGLQDLKENKQGKQSKFYPYDIYENCLPHIDKFLDNGFTKEEMKMVNETQKILCKKIKISATCVRVPISYCHSVSIYAKFKKEIDVNLARKALKDFNGIVLLDDTQNNIYPMPVIAKNTDSVYVGRVRKDLFCKKAISMFVCADNIRKGAASNAIEILEEILKTKNI